MIATYLLSYYTKSTLVIVLSGLSVFDVTHGRLVFYEKNQ